MNVVVVGTGYVGLVTGIGFADLGNEVTCVDIDKEKVALIQEGKCPIYEPGLAEMLGYNIRSGRLKFSTDLASVAAKAEVVFIAVGTPPTEDGGADLTHVLKVADQLGECMENYTVVVVKSTVPVGSCHRVKERIIQSAVKNFKKLDFDVASNPEFLKEGTAVEDFLKPDRIILGTDSDRALGVMQKLYEPFILNGHPMLHMDIASSEMTKYAANAMLATRISFMNEIARICETLGADISQVKRGIGADKRIGSAFLNAGIGYGGSCFPKDVKALIATAKEFGEEMRILDAVEHVNTTQRSWFFKKVISHFKGRLEGKTIALWGLAFKPGTDDMRMAPSLDLVSYLTECGAKVKVYDPIATETAKAALMGVKGVEYMNDAMSAAKGSDALILVTEWREFRRPDFTLLKSNMNSPVIFDARNQYSPALLTQYGFQYYCIGRGTAESVSSTTFGRATSNSARLAAHHREVSANI